MFCLVRVVHKFEFLSLLQTKCEINGDKCKVLDAVISYNIFFLQELNDFTVKLARRKDALPTLSRSRSFFSLEDKTCLSAYFVVCCQSRFMTNNVDTVCFLSLKHIIVRCL